MATANNRAKSSSGLVLVGIMLIVIVSHVNQVSSSSASIQQQQQQRQDFLIPTSNRVSSLAKRSLCNTFGGCGAKRSTPSLTYRRDFNSNMMAGRLAPTGQSNELFGETPDGDKTGPSEGGYQLSRAKFVNEILDDLYEQLQRDDRFKQVRVVAVLPRASNSMESQLSFMAQKEDQQQPFSSRADEQVQAVPMRRANYRL